MASPDMDRFAFAEIGVEVERDTKRGGWWFRGLGFEFFAHFSADIGLDDCELALRPDRLEANVAPLNAPENTYYLIVRLSPAGTISGDVFATACLIALARFFGVFGPPPREGCESGASDVD